MASADAVQKATYGSVRTMDEPVKAKDGTSRRLVLAVTIAGVLCAVGVIAVHRQLNSPSIDLFAIQPGSVFEVGKGQDKMALTVDSEVNRKGYAHAHGYKNGIRYAGLVKLTQKNLHRTKLSSAPSSIHRRTMQYGVQRVRSGTFDVQRQDDHNLTTYLVEVAKKPTTSLDQNPINAPTQPTPCYAPSCAGLSSDTPSSSTIQGSSSAIQNQKTVNINMIGFAGASTSVSNGPNNYFGGSFPQNPQPNNNFYGANTGGQTPANNNFIAGNLPLQQETKPFQDIVPQSISTGPQYQSPYPYPPGYQSQPSYQAQYPYQYSQWQNGGGPPAGFNSASVPIPAAANYMNSVPVSAPAVGPVAIPWSGQPLFAPAPAAPGPPEVQIPLPVAAPSPVAAPALPPVAVAPPAGVPQPAGGVQGPPAAPSVVPLPPAPAPAPAAVPVPAVPLPPPAPAVAPAPAPVIPPAPAPAPPAAVVPPVPPAAAPAPAAVAVQPAQIAPVAVPVASTVPTPIPLPPANTVAVLPPAQSAPSTEVPIVATPPIAKNIPVSPLPYNPASFQSSGTNRYYPACDPTNTPAYTSFTMCLFRSEVGLGQIPIIAQADTGLNRLYFVGKGYIPTVDIHDGDVLRSYIAGAPDTQIAWAIVGQLYISLAGTYTICSDSDDGTKLYVDGPLFVTNDFGHGMINKCGTTTLTSGSHSIYIEGFQGGGPFGMELTYSGPDTSGDFIFMRSAQLPSSAPPGGQYYSKCDPNQQPNPYKWTICTFRSSVDINLIPSIGQADTGINRLYYVGKGQLSVIDINDIWGFRKGVQQTPDHNIAWAIYGQLIIGTAGSYSLCATSDDGSKLYVDGPYLLVNNDGPHGMSEQCGTITLAAGTHTIYAEGYQGYGGLGMRLTYKGPDTNGVEILMPSGHLSSPYDPNCDPTSLKEPGPQFTVCVYSMDQWLWNVPRVGDAASSSLITLKGKGYIPVIDVHNAFTFQQYVPLAPDWNYVWVFYGYLLIRNSATYNLCINSDDGSQLFVDGSLLVNDDGYHGMIHTCGSIFLAPGRHLIYLTGMQGGGGVGMELTYSGPDTGGQEVFMTNNALPLTDPIAPQYFSACNPTTAPVATSFTICTFRSEIFLPVIPKIGLADTGSNRLYFIGKGNMPAIDFHNSNDIRSYVAGTPNDNIAWVIYGQILISNPGTYEVCSTSDDGSRVSVDGTLLVQNDGLHGMQKACGTKSLMAGYHVVYVEGSQGGGGVGHEVTYSGPDTGNVHIFLRSGLLPPSGPGSQYYSKCDPNVQPDPTKFTVCIFRSAVDMQMTPSISQADTGKNRLYYVGKGTTSSVDLQSLDRFREVVKNTPDYDFVWAIYGTLVIGTAGTYKLCINSDDGSSLYVDGPYLLVNNNGLHGMINQCNSISLTAGPHIVYIEGFQQYGGVGQRMTYSGPDTSDIEVIMPSGRKSSQYFDVCDPTALKPATQFQMCMFSAAWLPGFVPRIGDAVATHQISYLGQGAIPVIDVHNVETFRQYVNPTPDVNYVWAISGYMLISSAGTYTVCINSDDGSQLFLDGSQLVTDDGWHGMVHQCGNSYLTSGYHLLYLVGFQGGGGVGMELTYSGPDTANRELFIRAGNLPAFSFLKASPQTSLLQKDMIEQLRKRYVEKQKQQKSIQLDGGDSAVERRSLKSALILKQGPVRE